MADGKYMDVETTRPVVQDEAGDVGAAESNVVTGQPLAASTEKEVQPTSLGEYIKDAELIKGPPHNEKLVVFLHGWPDTRQVWSPIVPEVSFFYCMAAN